MPLKTIVSGSTPQASDADQYRQALTGMADIGTMSLCSPQGTPSVPTLSGGASGALTGPYAYHIAYATGFKQSDGSFQFNGFSPSNPQYNVYTGYSAATTFNRWNYSGTSGSALTSSGISHPVSIAVDNAGYLYAALNNTSGNTVLKATWSGTQVWVKADVPNAVSIALDNLGNVFVGYKNASSTKNVRCLNGSTGAEIWSLTDVGNASCVAYDLRGYLYVTYLNSSGKTLRCLNASTGAERWSLSDVPRGAYVAVDQVNLKLFVTYNNTSVSKALRCFDISSVTTSAPTETWFDTATEYAMNVDVGPDGCPVVIYGNPLGQPIVIKYAAVGSFMWADLSVGNASGIAIDNANNIYVSYNNSSGVTLQKFNSQGKSQWTDSSIATATCVAIDTPNTITLNAQKGSLSALPIGSSGCYARLIYRTPAYMTKPLMFCGMIGDNSSAAFTDNLSDSSLGNSAISSLPYGVYGTSISATLPLSNTTGTILSGYAQSSQQSWVYPTLLNSWVNYGSSYANARYYKDTLGIVHLSGVVKNGTTNTTIFTLPSGYRPASILDFTCLSNAAIAQVNVNSDGTVVLIVGSAVGLSLENISFRAEQ